MRSVDISGWVMYHTWLSRVLQGLTQARVHWEGGAGLRAVKRGTSYLLASRHWKSRRPL